MSCHQKIKNIKISNVHFILSIENKNVNDTIFENGAEICMVIFECASIHNQTSNKCLSKIIDPTTNILSIIILIQEIVR